MISKRICDLENTLANYIGLLRCVELWSLYDFVLFGELLGSVTDFKRDFVTPIVTGSLRNATEEDRVCGADTAERLRELIAPYFLRRDKQQTIEDAQHAAAGKTLSDASQTTSETCSNVDRSVSELEHGLQQMHMDADKLDGQESPTKAKHAGELSLPEKVDFVCWVRLSETQQQIYRTFLDSEKVQQLLNSTRSPLVRAQCCFQFG